MSRPNYCPNCGSALGGEFAAVGVYDGRCGDGGYDTSCRNCEWSGDIMPDDEQGRFEDDAARARQAGGANWLDRVPEPWLSVLKAEMYSRSRKARQILGAASGDKEALRAARERIFKMGLDPDGVPSAEDLGT